MCLFFFFMSQFMDFQPRKIAPVRTFHCSSPRTWPRSANQHTCSPSAAIRQSPAPHWLLCQRQTSHHRLPCLRLPPGKLSQLSAPPTARIPIGLTGRHLFCLSSSELSACRDPSLLSPVLWTVCFARGAQHNNTITVLQLLPNWAGNKVERII